MCVSTGWTWDYVADAVTLPRLAALSRVWASRPSVADSVAMVLRAFGWKPPSRRTTRRKDDALAELAALPFARAVGRVQ